MSNALLWALSIALILGGLAGTVLPVLPGSLLIFAGILVGAWIDDFARVPVWVVVLVGGLGVLAWALDYVAALAGAGRAGASRQAIAGAALGTVMGVFAGFIGLLFMPFLGAVLGELAARRGQARAEHQALRVGAATWLGLILGLMAKVVLAFVMVGLFVVALLV